MFNRLILIVIVPGLWSGARADDVVSGGVAARTLSSSRFSPGVAAPQALPRAASWRYTDVHAIPRAGYAHARFGIQLGRYYIDAAYGSDPAVQQSAQPGAVGSREFGDSQIGAGMQSLLLRVSVRP